MMFRSKIQLVVACTAGILATGLLGAALAQSTPAPGMGTMIVSPPPAPAASQPADADSQKQKPATPDNPPPRGGMAHVPADAVPPGSGGATVAPGQRGN